MYQGNRFTNFFKFLFVFLIVLFVWSAVVYTLKFVFSLILYILVPLLIAYGLFKFWQNKRHL